MCDLVEAGAVGIDRVEVRESRLRHEHREGDLRPVRGPDRLVATRGGAATRDRDLLQPAAVRVDNEDGTPLALGRLGREENLVPLWRPAATGEVELHPRRR